MKCYIDLRDLTLKDCEDITDLSDKLTTRINRLKKIDPATMDTPEPQKIVIFLEALSPN